MIEVISHHFIGGVYAKEMIIPDGFEVVSHAHEYDHMSVLSKGCVIVEADGVQETYYAPAVIEIKAGVNHSVLPVNGDAHWLCIHKTDCTDIAKVDDVLIQKKPCMTKIASGLPVESLLNEINEQPGLWNQYDMRTRMFETSPHREVDDIWLRYRNWDEFNPDDPQAFAGEHESVWYDAALSLPSLAYVLDQVRLQMDGEYELGGALITRIPPGKQVYRHSDAGYWHSEHYETKVLVLLQSAPGQVFKFDTEEHEGEAGDMFVFDNRPYHAVINNSDVDRISLILATRKV